MKRKTYGIGARLFHWSIAALVAVQIPLGIAMTSEPLAEFADPLFIAHKSLGVILLVVVFGRIAWRLLHPPPPFPDAMPLLERRLAHVTHMAIYAVLVVMVVSGYVRTVGDDYPIELMDVLDIPTLLPTMPGVATVMLVVHQFAVIGLVGLVAVHVAAVLQHHLIQRDHTLDRMWPPIPPREGDPRPPEADSRPPEGDPRPPQGDARPPEGDPRPPEADSRPSEDDVRAER